jgi:hypothetical protein
VVELEVDSVVTEVGHLLLLQAVVAVLVMQPPLMEPAVLEPAARVTVVVMDPLTVLQMLAHQTVPVVVVVVVLPISAL